MNLSLVFAVLLLSGHLVGEFLVQTTRVAEGKRRPKALSIHAVGLYASHWLLLYPFWSAKLALGLSVLTLIHLLVDFLRAHRPPTLGLFFADQVLHLVFLRLFWMWYVPDAGPLLRAGFTPGGAATFTKIALLAGVVGLNLRGGDTIVRLLLARFSSIRDKLQDAAEDMARTGTLIGMLERLLLLVMVLLSQWGAVGFILTAKSVARFDRLKKQGFSDYYMIGTLASLLVAVLSGLAAHYVLAYLS
ncbi:DUF3307 domain-containing protein [bacterium]|nr:DUF3307 domain-containing protein [bacterium]MBU1676305.1 DUF3307 domain-containing protein [bacterium]